jgi:apolipoprotein N-acyltransferase
LHQKLEGKNLRVCVIQGNIPQALKWDESAKPFIWKRYLELTEEASRQNPDLIIWPESAIPDYLQVEAEDNLKSLFDFVRQIKIPILLGITTVEGNNYFNSAILISKDGEIISRYDKIHLVPFGEYIPLRKILPFLETIVPIGDFTAGKDFVVFSYPCLAGRQVVKFSTLICFEDIFPEISRQFVKQGANFLVNITNDAWFGNTSAPYQHLSCSVFRAVENRVNLARAANTGISSIIDSNGKIISMVQDLRGAETFVGGFNAKQLFLNRRFSFYTNFGDIFVFGCALFLGYNIAANLGLNGKRKDR